MEGLSDPLSVSQRLEYLERAHRRLKGAVATALFGLVALGVMGQALPQSKTLEAERFVVRDPSGAARAGLGLGSDGTVALTLYDLTGKGVVATFGFNGTHKVPGVVLFDAVGRQRITLNVLPDGHQTLGFRDSAGTPRATFVVLADGSPSLDFWRPDGTRSWTAPGP